MCIIVNNLYFYINHGRILLYKSRVFVHYFSIVRTSLDLNASFYQSAIFLVSEITQKFGDAFGLENIFLHENYIIAITVKQQHLQLYLDCLQLLLNFQAIPSYNHQSLHQFH